jgi:hypothetical protein
MRFSNWAEIISLKHINCLLFVTESQPVPFDEENDILNVIQKKMLLQNIKIVW